MIKQVRRVHKALHRFMPYESAEERARNLCQALVGETQILDACPIASELLEGYVQAEDLWDAVSDAVMAWAGIVIVHKSSFSEFAECLGAGLSPADAADFVRGEIEAKG